MFVSRVSHFRAPLLSQTPIVRPLSTTYSIVCYLLVQLANFLILWALLLVSFGELKQRMWRRWSRYRPLCSKLTSAPSVRW